jgi:hypothetical protein
VHRQPSSWYNLCMETIKKISDIDPSDRAVVERVFGQRLEAAGNIVLILKTVDAAPSSPLPAGDELPSWCNVLDGLSDEDLAEFDATLNEPVRLARPA